jgi:hypothetical protein
MQEVRRFPVLVGEQSDLVGGRKLAWIEPLEFSRHSWRSKQAGERPG